MIALPNIRWLLDLIKAGRKTETRRAVKSRQRLGKYLRADGHWVSAIFDESGLVKWYEGGVLEVKCDRDGVGEGYIVITKITHRLVSGITEKEAHDEGFPNKAAFLKFWKNELYGDYESVYCWVLKFIYLGETKP